MKENLRFLLSRCDGIFRVVLNESIALLLQSWKNVYISINTFMTNEKKVKSVSTSRNIAQQQAVKLGLSV